MWSDGLIPRWVEFDSIKVNDSSYGVCRCIPGVAPEDGFEYLAGLEVKSTDNIPDGMVFWEIPAQTYAVLPVNGLSDIMRVYNYIYKEWLPNSSEYTRGDGPDFEFYPESFCENHILYYYFPVKSK